MNQNLNKWNREKKKEFLKAFLKMDHIKVKELLKEKVYFIVIEENMETHTFKYKGKEYPIESVNEMFKDIPCVIMPEKDKTQER